MSSSNSQSKNNPFNINFDIEGEMPDFPEFNGNPSRSSDGLVYALVATVPIDETDQTLAMGYEELGNLDVFYDYTNVSIETGLVRPGGSVRSLRVNPSSNVAFATWGKPFIEDLTEYALQPKENFNIYGYCTVRSGIYVATMPASDQVICEFNGGSANYYVKLTSTGYLKFYAGVNLIGTSTDAIVEDEWTLLEMFVRPSSPGDDYDPGDAISALGLRLNGSLQIYENHISYVDVVEYFTTGSSTDNNSYDIYWDDVKVRGGIAGNFWIGDGHIVYRKADGSITSDFDYFNNVNSTNVDEMPPDDGTTSDIADAVYPGYNMWGQLYPIDYEFSAYQIVTVTPCIRLRDHVGVGMLDYGEVSVQTAVNGEVVFGMQFTDVPESSILGLARLNYVYEMLPTVDFAWRLKHIDRNSSNSLWTNYNLMNLQVGVYKDDDDAPFDTSYLNAEITTAGVLIDYGTEEDLSISEDRETLIMGLEEFASNDVFLAAGGNYETNSSIVNPGGSEYSLRLYPSAGTGYTTWAGISFYSPTLDAGTTVDNARPVANFGREYTTVSGVNLRTLDVAIRFYLNVDVFPSVDSDLFVVNGDVSNFVAKLTSGGLIKYYDDVTLIGTSTTPISEGVWTKIEAIVQIEDGINSVKIGSSEEISGAGSNSNTKINSVTFGCSSGTNTYDVYLDDIKIARARTIYQTYYGFPAQYIGGGKIVYCPPNGVTSSTADAFNNTNSNNVDELPPSDDITTNDSVVVSGSGGGPQLYPLDFSFFDDKVVGRYNTVMWACRPKNDTLSDNYCYLLAKADGLPEFGVNGYLQIQMEIDTNWYWRLYLHDRPFDANYYEVSNWTRDQLDTAESGFGSGPANDTYRITTVGALVDYSTVEPEGGLIVGGETTPTLTFNHTPSGGLVAGGEVDLVIDAVYVPTGGITFGGNGEAGLEYVGSGDLTFGVVGFTDYITTLDPLVWWRFNEASNAGTALNSGSSGYLLHSTYLGNPTQGPSLITDEPTVPSRFFNGIDQSVYVPNSDELNLLLSYSARTITLWFRPSNTIKRQVIYEEGDAARGINIYILNGFVYATAWNYVYEGVGTNTPWSLVSVVSPIEGDGTYNISLVMDSTARTFKGYLNGVLINSVSNIGILGTHPRPSIGCKFQGTRYHDLSSTGTGDYYNGSIDEIIIFDTPLSATDIALNYLYSHPRYAYSVNYEYTGTGGFSFGGTSGVFVSLEYTGSGGITFDGSADSGFIYEGSGGITFGGTLDTPVGEFVFTPTGGMTAGGNVDASIDFVYEGSGGISFGGTAIVVTDPVFAYTGSGGIEFSGENLPTISYFIFKEFSWNIVQEIDVLKSFSWNLAQSVYKQYLVQFECGKTDACGNVNNMQGCSNSAYAPNLTMFAKSLEDIRLKLLELDFDRGVSKIYVYENPLFKSDFTSSNSLNCNSMIDITPSVNDPGWESLMEFGVFVAASESEVILSSVVIGDSEEIDASCGDCSFQGTFGEGDLENPGQEWYWQQTGFCNDGCECSEPDYLPTVHGEYATTSCSTIPPFSMLEALSVDSSYEGEGGISFGGSADVVFTDYYGIFIAESESESLVNGQDIEYTYDPIDSGEVDVLDISNTCSSNAIPAKIFVSHNLVESSLKLKQFLVRNNKTVDSAIPLYYSSLLKTWNNSLNFVGYSSVNNQQEIWNIIFEFGCISENQQNIWKFDFLMKRQAVNGRNVNLTRSTIYFDITTQGLKESSLNLDIALNTNTLVVSPDTSDISPTFYDDGNFFSSKTFLDDPVLTFGIKNAIISTSVISSKISY